jgi:diacylglycerol kinase (ATP)
MIETRLRACTRMGARVVRLARSFRFAARGVRVASSGPNLRIHLAADTVVAFLAVAYGLTGVRLGLVIGAAAVVIAAEIVNTAVERLCDFIAELHGIGQDPRIRDIKDLTAGAVLVVAVGAAGIGVIVLGPLLAGTR